MNAPFPKPDAPIATTINGGCSSEVPRELAILPAFAENPLKDFDRMILRRFRSGEDTKAIARALNHREAFIYNSIAHARSVERARIAAGVEP